jgi:hypothetical protein
MDDDGIDEAPNEKGISAQQMRHNEKLVNKVVEAVEIVSKHAKETQREQAKRIFDLEKTLMGNWEQFMRLQDVSHERNLEMRKLEKDENRKDEMAGFLMSTGQIMANKLLGAKVFEKQNTTPIEQTLFAFFNTFTPEQVEDILKTNTIQLNMSQRMGFLHMFQTFFEHVKQRNAAQNGQGGGTGEQPGAPPGGQ